LRIEKCWYRFYGRVPTDEKEKGKSIGVERMAKIVTLLIIKNILYLYNTAHNKNND